MGPENRLETWRLAQEERTAEVKAMIKTQRVETGREGPTAGRGVVRGRSEGLHAREQVSRP